MAQAVGKRRAALHGRGGSWRAGPLMVSELTADAALAASAAPGPPLRPCKGDLACAPGRHDLIGSGFKQGKWLMARGVMGLHHGGT